MQGGGKVSGDGGDVVALAPLESAGVADGDEDVCRACLQQIILLMVRISNDQIQLGWSNRGIWGPRYNPRKGTNPAFRVKSDDCLSHGWQG